MSKYYTKRRGRNVLNLSGERLYKFSGEDDTGYTKVEKALGGIGSIAGGITTIIDSAKKNAQIADTSAIEASIENTGNADFSENSDYQSFLDSISNFNYAKDDYEMSDVRGVSGWDMVGNTLSSIGAGATAGFQSGGGPWGAIAGAAVGLGSSLAGIFIGNKKAREKAAELNAAAELANDRADASKMMQFNSLNNDSYIESLKNLAADGGSIHIKKKNRGKFTASAKRAGMGVQEFARHVLANRDKYSPTTVKRANFARNFGGRKHGEGGNLLIDIPDYQTHGGDFSNGMTIIDAGGTHESNPYEGVLMGIAPDGTPNLVEEGEVIYRDYVFSDRLHPSKDELRDAGLPGKYKGHTFALIAEDMGKESSERPNDPISKRGLEDSMMKLAMIQEAQRAKKGKNGTQKLMAYGGRKYAGNSDLDNPYNDPYIGSKEQALEEAELNYYASKSPEIQEELRQIRGNNQASDPLPTWMRYAPAAGSAIGAIQSIFQKPNYENADILMQEARSLSRPSVRYRALNNYLTYRPLDRNYYLNQLKGQAGATRRAIANSTGNAGTAMAGLLAADYNAQNAVGNTLMKMEQYNDAQRQRVAEFNRGTDMANSQGFMQADQANAQIAQNRDRLRSSLMTQAAQMREAADTALEATRSANLTNFFDNLGGIGRENMGWNWTKYLADSGAFGQLREGVPMPGFRKGGMLTKRNRRRR